MKNKKILIIGFIVIAVLLIGAGTVYSLFDKEPAKKEHHVLSDPIQEEQMVTMVNDQYKNMLPNPESSEGISIGN